MALLVIDMIKVLEFDGGEKLWRFALPMGERHATLQGDFRPSSQISETIH
ncbi:hypothetical protein RMSM_01444 [Rhodopirellula maiorica SM1]|uniref:Uncharacterized protein n=1 Tax=Rhodopirellula maiorica SM1 TaxID=1265738 RepID=M5RQL3_9BACT|nr:hypothetical protein RMSM_01444 [Rhodopirellula maiorica SM1]